MADGCRGRSRSPCGRLSDRCSDRTSEGSPRSVRPASLGARAMRPTLRTMSGCLTCAPHAPGSEEEHPCAVRPTPSSPGTCMGSERGRSDRPLRVPRTASASLSPEGAATRSGGSGRHGKSSRSVEKRYFRGDPRWRRGRNGGHVGELDVARIYELAGWLRPGTAGGGGISPRPSRRGDRAWRRSLRFRWAGRRPARCVAYR